MAHTAGSYLVTGANLKSGVWPEFGSGPANPAPVKLESPSNRAVSHGAVNTSRTLYTPARQAMEVGSPEAGTRKEPVLG